MKQFLLQPIGQTGAGAITGGSYIGAGGGNGSGGGDGGGGGGGGKACKKSSLFYTALWINNFENYDLNFVLSSNEIRKSQGTECLIIFHL